MTALPDGHLPQHSVAGRLGTLELLQSECAQFVLLKMILIKNYLDNFSERNCFYEKSRNNYGQ